MITEGHGYGVLSPGIVRSPRTRQADKELEHSMRSPEVLNRISNFESETVAAYDKDMSREAWHLAKEARLSKLRQEIGWMEVSSHDGKRYAPAIPSSKTSRSLNAKRRPAQEESVSPDFGAWRRSSNGSSASTISQINNESGTAVKHGREHEEEQEDATSPGELIAPYREGDEAMLLLHSPSPCNSIRGVTPSDDDLLLEGSRPAPGYEDIQKHIHTLRGIKRIQPGMKSSPRLTVVEPSLDWEALAPVAEGARSHRNDFKSLYEADHLQNHQTEAGRQGVIEEEATQNLHGPRRSEPLWKPKGSMPTLKLSDRSLDKSSQQEKSNRVLKTSILELETTAPPRKTKLPSICQVSPWDDDKKLLIASPKRLVHSDQAPRRPVNHFSIVPPLQLPPPLEKTEERSWTQRKMEQADKFYPKIKFYMPNTARPAVSPTTDYCRKVMRFFPVQSSSFMQILGKRSKVEVQQQHTARG
ncbi:hypothetical protein GUITHDRAFT_101468 [Guillardia theta CCMP2712]|uniref:Uncharacterized protein n=1 Tax=Guillardia theta (strain CCMP2712) TaxID=905079 RepID=L1JXD1_GUITC|nr:hypothetical protein GUITHDRAFT_101468 [Guillardia theta CCMP2712]EKX53022.1 hypothetical protein GUITHDRAFT_101468 [Guillardia theta CCMP2712]|eukprot:XP_005840002.1 hypothetical protein GUITHDRAFT_101468 [Guillardia theta CCMP2712]